ncbi:uncharacterized protein [Triticum aestivum]|uniref:uncharacterized protein isoform X2 n=1 Tax=Triticum aestivum TaxID=4565 RepID=UPI001D00EDCC|nr:uncharacterized protein LOC123150577 isoform X2 [Triticum aestivum]
MGFDLSISTSTRPALFIILVPDIHHMTILLCCIKNNCVRTIPAESIDDKTKLKGFSEFENTYYKRPKINGRCWCHTFEVLMETNKHLCRKAIEMCKSQSQQGMVILPAEKKSRIVDLTWQPCISFGYTNLPLSLGAGISDLNEGSQGATAFSLYRKDKASERPCEIEIDLLKKVKLVFLMSLLKLKLVCAN